MRITDFGLGETRQAAAAAPSVPCIAAAGAAGLPGFRAAPPARPRRCSAAACSPRCHLFVIAPHTCLPACLPASSRACLPPASTQPRATSATLSTSAPTASSEPWSTWWAGLCVCVVVVVGCVCGCRWVLGVWRLPQSALLLRARLPFACMPACCRSPAPPSHTPLSDTTQHNIHADTHAVPCSPSPPPESRRPRSSRGAATARPLTGGAWASCCLRCSTACRPSAPRAASSCRS